jgi:hypothetical protein
VAALVGVCARALPVDCALRLRLCWQTPFGGGGACVCASSLHSPPPRVWAVSCSSQVSGIPLGVTNVVSVRAVRQGLCAAATPAASLAWFEPAAGVGVPFFVTAPSGSLFSSYGSFVFGSTAAAGSTSFEYSLDGSSWARSAPSLRVGPVSPGPHTLALRCTDEAEVSPEQSVSWTVLSQSGDQLSVGGHITAVTAVLGCGHGRWVVGVVYGACGGGGGLVFSMKLTTIVAASAPCFCGVPM